MTTRLMATRSKHKRIEGFSLVEAVVGMVMFLSAAAGLMPLIIISRTFSLQSDSRIGAIAVSQQLMDTLRQADVATLPSSGTATTLPSGDSIASLPYKGRTYSATITYCENTTLCDSATRQIKVKIYHDGNTVANPTRTCDSSSRNDNPECPIYQLETIYARLQ
jgi:type II secretory pathway pseudopilin PulG